MRSNIFVEEVHSSAENKLGPHANSNPVVEGSKDQRRKKGQSQSSRSLIDIDSISSCCRGFESLDI